MRDIVVSDLDDTLVASNGDPIAGVLTELLDKQAEGYAVVIVSARQLDRFDESKAWLADNGLKVNDADLHLSDFPRGGIVGASSKFIRLGCCLMLVM